MKKSLLPAILLMLTLAASCSKVNIFNLPDIDATVGVGKESVITPDEIIISDTGTKVTPGKDGVLYAEKDSGMKLVSETPAGETVRFEGTLSMPKEQIPVNSGSVNPGLLLKVHNPGSESVLDATLVVGNEEMHVGPVTVPADDECLIFLGHGDDLPAPDWCDLRSGLPEKANVKEGFVLKDITLHTKMPEAVPATKSEDDENTETATYWVEASYCSPLIYGEGEKIHIERSFSDLDFDLTKYTDKISGHKFVVNGEITNRIPFSIEGTLSSAEGLDAALEGSIPAGSPESPSEGPVTVTVNKSNSDLSVLDSMTIVLDLTATQGATLRQDQSITLRIDNIKVTLIEF